MIGSKVKLGSVEAAKGSKQIPDPRIPWPTEHAPATARVFAQNIVDVAASPQAVWSQLIECIAWPQWYKHCSDVSILRGGPCLVADSQFRFKTLGFYFEPEVVTFEPHQTLVWSAKGPAGTSGSHAWYRRDTRRLSRHHGRVAERPASFLLRSPHTRPARGIA